VRTGLMLYGVSPVPPKQSLLREVVTWNTRVILVRTLPAEHGVSYGRTFVTDRPTRVATLAVGYADGYPRHLSGQGAWVWLGGQRCPILGRITMDQIMVEAPDHVQPGDPATLLGGHGPAATELATRAHTIPYEIFCGLGRRVARLVRH
jgi:alanine racemase